MKPRFITRPISCSTNPDRTIPSNTLYSKHNHCLLICHQYLPRFPIRMTILLPQRDLKCRSNLVLFINSDSLHRIYFTMSTNIILRGHSNYKPTINHPIRRTNTSRMTLGRLLRRQPDLNLILHTTLYTPLCTSGFISTPSTFPTQDRI
uniref:Uncharacterized protein n=1 Tax=Salvator merianae TaxID=96440 RepID=A0A8D0B6V8_SALMN